jgi:type II secretory pathway component PulK
MIVTKPVSGFAIFTVILLLAVISLIGLAMSNLYLTNTRSTSLDVQRLKAQHLLDSGVRFAALSLASPRVNISASAIPSERIIYSSPVSDVVIDIQNEAGFISLLNDHKEVDNELLRSAVLASGASRQGVAEIIKSIQALNKQGSEPSYRKLRQLLRDSSIDIRLLLSVTSLHNEHQGVHPSVAPVAVLALVPKLSKAQRERLLAARSNPQTSLISSPVESDYFSSGISAYYRIATSVELDGQRYDRIQIIKMINQRGRLYEVQATL